MQYELNLKEILGLETLTPAENLKLIRPLVLYGAGGFCEAVFQKLAEINVEPVAVCDSNPGKIGKTIYGYVISSFEDVLLKYKEFHVLITAFKYYDEIKSMLLKHISPDRIATFSFLNDNASRYRTLINNNRGNIEAIFNKLEDSNSREVFEKILKGAVTNDSSCYYSARTGRQYFPEDIVKFSDNEYFVDGGAYIGDSIKEFIDNTGNKYAKIYSFEPSSEIYNQLLKTKAADFNNDSRISIYPYGLYHDSRRTGFDSSIGGGSDRIDERADTGNFIDVVSMDSFIDDKVTFIKMDIEGSELAALKGARETILKNKPKLAICVYHKPEDIFEIPEYIMSLGLDYKYHIRHHGIPPFSQNETVFYAI